MNASQSGKTDEIDSRNVHPEWAAWIEASAYTMADARKELGVPNGTFYRRIAKEPTTVDRLAMRALYEGLAGFTAEVVAHDPAQDFSRVALSKVSALQQRCMRRVGIVMTGPGGCCVVSSAGRVLWDDCGLIRSLIDPQATA